MKCPDCGEDLIPLLTSMVCRNDCDKPNGPLCPECASFKTEPFDVSGILDCFAIDDDVRNSETYHCWPCGHVWNIDPQNPETD